MPRNFNDDDFFERHEQRMDKMLDHPVRTFFFGSLAAVAIYAVLFAVLVGIVLVALSIAGVI